MRLLVLTCLLGALIAAPAAAATVQEAEGMRVVRGSGKVVRDASAGGGRAVRFARKGALRFRLSSGEITGIIVRARVRSCAGAPMLTVRVGERTRRMRVRARSWTDHRLAVRVDGGRNTVALAMSSLPRRGRCRPYLDLDRVVVDTAGPATPGPRPPAPTPAPSPSPAPPPPSEPPPPPGPLPPSPLSPLLPDPQRTGPVPLGAALFFAHTKSDPEYRAAFLREFSVLTPENEMKMERLQPLRGVFSFAESDALVAFAQENGKAIHGHTLVWHGQLPSWVHGTTWTADELTAVMKEHIQTVIARYKGKVTEWDVVNEPFNPDGSYRDNIWHSVIGPSYIEKALRFAREADANARLYINEIGAELINPQSDALFHLAETYKLLGVPLDGVGFQNHTNHNGYPRRDPLIENFRRFASLGLEVQVTEMDVAANGSPESFGERLTAQSTAYRDAAEACWYVAACKRFTVWGVTDRYSWIGAAEIPLLLDADYAAKPALGLVRDVLDG